MTDNFTQLYITSNSLIVRMQVNHIKPIEMATKFRKIFKVANKEAIQWFPGHMGKGMRQMQQRLKLVDCVIEVHDARIPFSGRNVDFKSTITGIRPHILVLNKKDISDATQFKSITETIKRDEGVDNILYTNCRDHQCEDVRRIVPLVKKLIANSNRYNRSEEPEFNIMMIGVPNVGKSSLINALRNRHLKTKNATAVGSIPGITRSVLNRIKISTNPLIYMYDTPGILTPRITDMEQGMKLALIACLQDHLVGLPLIADYLLYWLNKNQHFGYVELMNLTEATDNIEEVLLSGAKMLNKTQKVKKYDGSLVIRPDFDAAATYFIRAFRNGELGKFNLDKEYTARK